MWCRTKHNRVDGNERNKKTKRTRSLSPVDEEKTKKDKSIRQQLQETTAIGQGKLTMRKEYTKIYTMDNILKNQDVSNSRKKNETTK